jgi:hypothetical protein
MGPQEDLLPLRLPAALKMVSGQLLVQHEAGLVADGAVVVEAGIDGQGTLAQPQSFTWQEQQVRVWAGGPVEFDRVVPASGNMFVAGRQFWLGPDRAGITVAFWADTEVIHLLVAGVWIKSFRSHLSLADLAKLAARGGRVAGPAPLPAAEAGSAVEVDRTVSKAGTVSLAGRIVLAAEILGGRRVSVRIEEHTLMFFDPYTRELLRTRPNPLSAGLLRHLRDARPAGPPPRPSVEPITVQRVASNSGVIMVAGQKVALGRLHARAIVTDHLQRGGPVLQDGEETRNGRTWWSPGFCRRNGRT